MDIRSNKGDMCNMVCENSILALGHRRGSIKSKKEFGEEVKCGGASPEDGVQTPFGIMRTEKEVKSVGGQTGLRLNPICCQNQSMPYRRW